MRQAIFFLLIVLSKAINAQQEPLYYFISKDSLLGVKDSKGKIIIPSRHLLVFDIKNGDIVEGGFINLIETGDTLSAASGNFGTMYNRKGEFLYKPFIYDNGPDYLQEGLTRFIEDNKIGFVDRHAKKIIPAKFDFVSSFTLGTAVFCMGCYFDRSEDSEHPPLRGGYYGIINKRGKVLINNIPEDTNSRKWRIFDSLKLNFYPKEFQYTSFEKNIIGKLNSYKKALEKEYFSNWSGFTKPWSLMFDIVEKPSSEFPYYVIVSRAKFGKEINGESLDALKFYFNKNDQAMYYYDGSKLISFKRWYNIYIKGSRNYD